MDLCGGEECLPVVWLTPTTVLLKQIGPDVLVGRDAIIRLCRCLVGYGVKDMLTDHVIQNHRIPWGAMIQSGPLAGLWHMQPVLVLAGQDGNY